MLWEPGAFNFDENSIALNKPWDNGGFEIGQKVSQSSWQTSNLPLILEITSTSDYKYFDGYLKGIAKYPNYNTLPPGSMFPGTERIKLRINIPPSVPNELNHTVFFTNFFLKEIESYTITIDKSLQASAWTGAVAPFVQTVVNPDITPASDIKLNVFVDSTLEQRAAMRAALCWVKAAEGKATIFADGQKPSINIPITLEITNYAN